MSTSPPCRKQACVVSAESQAMIVKAHGDWFRVSIDSFEAIWQILQGLREQK